MIHLTTLVYVRKGDQTLLVHMDKKPAGHPNLGKWNAPGGHFEDGETPEECAIREVKEETGLTIKNPKIKGFLTFPDFFDDGDEYMFLLEATEFEGELLQNAPEGTVHWIDNDKAMDRERWPGDKLFEPWMEDGRFFSAKIVYNKGKIVDHSVVFRNE